MWTTLPDNEAGNGEGRSWFWPAPLVGVWRGDARALRVDAVVNAANDGGLGCFTPDHRCVDNILHRAAGPRLRQECRTLMQARRKLPAGAPPLLTRGYWLPAANVLHVTGPRLHPGSPPVDKDRELLAACYTGCLDAAKGAGLRSVGFCCISTGLFAFPQREAAEIALGAVKQWLSTNPSSMDAVIFICWRESDEAIYRELAPQLYSRVN